MKKKVLIFGICVLCFATLITVTAIKYTTIIGTIRGAELETIIIGDTVYQYDESLDFSSADKGQFLGIVTNEQVRFGVYSVKGDTHNQYIYRLWGHDGAFYIATP